MITDALIKVYKIVNKTKLLETKPGKYLFRTAYFFYKRNFEDSYINLVKQNPGIFSGGNIIDVGANIGYTSILFAQNITPGYKVYALEPHPLNFKQLEENIVQFKQADKIVALQAAVGNSNGEITLWENPTSHADHRIMTDSLENSLKKDETKTLNVPIMTLDSLAAKESLKNTVSFIKIDVQGYEIPVLEGMREVIKNNPQAKICLEYSPSMLSEMGFNANDIFDFFPGYKIYSLTRKGVHKFEIEKGLKELGDDYIDLIFSAQPL